MCQPTPARHQSPSPAFAAVSIVYYFNQNIRARTQYPNTKIHTSGDWDTNPPPPLNIQTQNKKRRTLEDRWNSQNTTDWNYQILPGTWYHMVMITTCYVYTIRDPHPPSRSNILPARAHLCWLRRQYQHGTKAHAKDANMLPEDRPYFRGRVRASLFGLGKTSFD